MQMKFLFYDDSKMQPSPHVTLQLDIVTLLACQLVSQSEASSTASSCQLIPLPALPLVSHLASQSSFYSTVLWLVILPANNLSASPLVIHFASQKSYQLVLRIASQLACHLASQSAYNIISRLASKKTIFGQQDMLTSPLANNFLD